MNTPLLDKISSPDDLKKLTKAQLISLCAEIRDFLLASVSKTGGHLASNLGVIELTVALHYVLHSPIDQFVFDVGHQCYTHKLLTGRRDAFPTLRQLDGLSGFPKPAESEHDVFIAGHGNTSISVAIGKARAKQIKNEPGKVIAIIGDGAFTGGMVYEGLNNIEHLDNLVIILNDNTMSISKNVGAMARYLTKLRTTKRYFNVKETTTRVLDSMPFIGKPVKKGLQFCKMRVRRTLYHSTWFENLGFQYVGPMDGHDIMVLTRVLDNLKQQTKPIFIHLVTQKGKGYLPAEENPGEFHGVSSFNPQVIIDPDVAQNESFSTAFGKSLDQIAHTDNRICAITAAMKYGTGLQFFHHNYPERFFDVGMAEQHAVTFAAGLASEGMRPVVALYSTFLQRSYDQMIHDVQLMKLNVLFAIDRAGIVPGDGETHQGIADPAYLRSIGIRTISPCNYAELSYWLKSLLSVSDGASALRYPRGKESSVLQKLGCSGQVFDCILQTSNARIVLVSYGSETEDILCAAQNLIAENISVDCYKLTQIYPLSVDFVNRISQYQFILFAEECISRGGIGESLQVALIQHGWDGHFAHCAVDHFNLPHAQVAQIKERIGLNAVALTKRAKELLS